MWVVTADRAPSLRPGRVGSAPTARPLQRAPLPRTAAFRETAARLRAAPIGHRSLRTDGMRRTAASIQRARAGLAPPVAQQRRSAARCTMRRNGLRRMVLGSAASFR